MTRFTKTILTPALAALTLCGATLAGSAPAEAGHWRYRYHYGYGYHGRAVAAGLIGGLALGALAAAAARPAYVEPYACYVVRRRFVTRHGDVHVRRVRVCE